MSTQAVEIVDGIQRGVIAAVLHVAASNSAAAREIAREFVAAADEVRVQSELIPLSSIVASAFAKGLSREQLLKLSSQCRNKVQLLDAVKSGARLVSRLGEAELDRYRRVVVEAAARAATEIKESEFFSRRRRTRAELAALGEITAALAGTTVPRRPTPAQLDIARTQAELAAVPART